MSVFFHTSNRNIGQFGLKLVIVAEEASAVLMDRFEAIAENVFTQLNLESTIDRIEHLEKQMYTRQSKSKHPMQVCMANPISSLIELKEVQHLAVCYKPLQQYTSLNCMNPYSKELNRPSVADQDKSGESSAVSQGGMSNYAKSYMKTVGQFEKLYHMYMSAKNKKEVLITQKYALETYGLLAKSDMVILVCMAHNRTSKSVGEVLHEQLQQAKSDKDRKFILKFY